jgi:GT2 family glycosyltransferase
MFVEDVDLCYRLVSAGWRVVFAPVTEVTHAIGASVSAKRFRMVVEHARSLDRFFARRYATGPARALRPLIGLGLAAWVVVALVWSVISGRPVAQG